MCLYVCVRGCVWLVFYVTFKKYFSCIKAVAACCMRRDSAWSLSAINTDAPCRRHNTLIHHSVTLSWHRANQSWCYPLNAERLARKQSVPLLTPLVWRDPRPHEYNHCVTVTCMGEVVYKPSSIYTDRSKAETCFVTCTCFISYTSFVHIFSSSERSSMWAIAVALCPSSVRPSVR